MENQEMGAKKKSRAKYEWLILIVVVIAVIAVSFGIYAERSKAQKGELLISELEQMRAAVMTYKTLNKTNPPDLPSLAKATYEFSPGEKPRNFLVAVQTNAKGELVDPFGNPYKYDTKTGWVSSGTPGYTDW